MNQTNKVSYTKGMNMDISKTKYPQSSYYILNNGTIISGDSTDAMEISTITGNTKLLDLPSIGNLINTTYYTTTLQALIVATSVSFAQGIQNFLTASCPNWATDLTKRLSIIGYASVSDKTFIFCKELITNRYSSIFELIVDDTKDVGDIEYITLKLKYINDSLNFGYIGSEAECVYENENITHLYWADGINQLRMYNTTNENNFFKHYTQLNQVPEVILSIIKLRNVIVSGNLPVGSVQYSYQYFNKNGQTSAFMPTTGLIHLTTEPEGSQLYNEYKARLYHGADVGTNSGKSIILEVNEVDTRFDCIRVVQIFYSSINSLPTIKIIFEQELLSNAAITILDDGNKFIGNLSISDFTKPALPIIPKTIATKDNILFAGNIVEDLFSSSSWDNFCTRSYRFNNTKSADVYSDESFSSYKHVTANSNNVVTDWNDLDNNSTEYVVNPYNIPSVSDPSISNNYSQTTNQYKYMSDGCTLGGSGPNIDFKFTVKRAVLDNGNTSGSADVHDIRPIYDTAMTTSETISNDGIFTNDYKSPYISSKYRTYQRDDIYRFALVVYSKTGLASEPKWIADIRMPDGTLSTHAVDSDKLWHYSAFVGQVDSTTKMNILGIDFRVTFTQELLSEIQGYSIVRCKRDETRQILGNGIISPYIYKFFDSVVTPFNPMETDVNGFRIKWNPSDRDSLTRKKTSKKVNADLVSNSFHNIQGYIGNGQHNYHGFANHNYTYLNEGANYGGGNPIVTDSGVCAFISPEHLFTDNLKINKACRIVPISGYRVVNNLAGVLNAGCLWTDYTTETLQMDGVKLSPNTTISDVFPFEIDSYKTTAPLEDYKLDKSYHTDDTTIAIVDKTLVNGLVYGSNPPDHLSFGSNITISIKEQLSLTRDSKLVSPLRATIKDIMSSLGKEANFDELSDQFLINCNIKQNTSPYKGQSLSSILNSEYISTGSYISDLNTYNGQWASSIPSDNSPAKEEESYLAGFGYVPVGSNNQVGSTIFGGDIFLSMFQYLSQWGTDLTTEEIITPVARYTTTLLIPVESTINCNLRHDIDIFTISKNRTVRNIGEKAMFRAASKAGSEDSATAFYHDYAQEKDLYLYNTVYSKQNDIMKFTPITNKEGITHKGSTRVMASLPKLNGEYSDSWSKFGNNQELELTTKFGNLCKLYVFKDVLYGFQNTGIARLAVNDKSTSQDPNNPLVIGTTGILQYYQYIVDSGGTTHKDSITSTEDTLFYFDTDKNRIFYLSGEDGDLSSITGLNSYFIDNEIAVDNFFPSILSVYDKVNKQVLFKLTYRDTSKLPNVLVFNKMIKAFTNFITVNPSIYINTSKHLFTQKTLSSPLTDDYGLYIENEGLQCTWYEEYKRLTCTLIINPTVNELIKMFDFIEFMTTSIISGDTDKFNVLNLPITSIRLYNDYQDTQSIDLLTLNSRDQYFQKQRNRTFRVSRLRDKLDTSTKNQLARIKDYYVYVDIEFDKESLSSPLNSEDIKFTLKDLFVSYRDLKTTQL